MNKILLLILLLMLAVPCRAQGIDDIFTDEEEMFNIAHALLFEYSDETPENLVKYAREQLAEAGKSADAMVRRQGALNAWFASLYAQMRNKDNFQTQAKMKAEIDTCIGESAKILGIDQRNKNYIRPAIDYLKGKLPARCGISKGVVPVTGDIRMIILDDGIGNRRTMYYHTPKSSDDPDCGKLPGSICFQILDSMPVTPALREAGVRGDTMTFIEQCVVPD